MIFVNVMGAPETISFKGKNKQSYESFIEYDVETQTKGSETDANGKKLKYEYDQWQRIVKISTPYDDDAIIYKYGTFDTNFIEGNIQIHPFWYALTKNKVNFKDDRTIDTLVLASGENNLHESGEINQKKSKEKSHYQF